MGKLSFTFNNIRKDYIQMLVGRKRPSWAPVKRKLVRVPHRAGALLLNTETEERRIDVPLVIKAKKDMADLQKLKEDLADWLYTEQPAELIFDDELDRTYLALIDGSVDLDEIVNRGRGVITFVCPMPYKLGKINTHKFTQEWSTETTSYFTNKGNVEAPALIEMTVKKPSTFLDVWFGEYPRNRDYFRIGYPLTVEQTTVQERERVMWDEMTTPVGWTPVTGQVEEMKGTGSFKSRDGYALYCEDYGQEKGFHGAIAKKNIPGGPIQDFEMEAWVRLKSKSIGEMGRVEVLLLDDTSNIVARINMNDLYWDAEITKAYMRIGNAGTPNSIRKLVDTNGAHPNTFNQFYGRLRIARRGKEWSVYVSRFRDGTEIDDASLPVKWVDEVGNPMTERKIAQVMIAICKWDNNQPVDIIQIDDLKIWKVNKVPSNAQPYIFDTGDKIVIDTEKSLVTINGKNAINLKEIFSNFPIVIRGENRIDIMPPDVNATISYRERYR
ncbi:phage tail protein [Bacillus thuringiensis serovar brasilensis]|uniref:distal tail protein Dit n=1 Tax=Bacillus cereus group TaxID=86661 RepID=UPI000A3B70A6|nr:distal tail protein Dit [Bacillus thuringiensis]MCU5032151.1 phage tail family protein [Bacillus cereus]MRA70047.1 phage tail family protein [Bacillus thuringiensis]MRA88529.1 phage tail family protein [Bacillus thuringiensis]MRC51748.1 phage tail family protein [Bacillus thuringiensis]OTX26902.1 phage tail protein [Bacillus thuringiensis serovar brasilensis]